MTLPKSTMQIDQITTSDLLANQASSRREKKAITAIGEKGEVCRNAYHTCEVAPYRRYVE